MIAVDPTEVRREVALNAGADFVPDPKACDVGLEIKRLTVKTGADCIIETSGAPSALQSALRDLPHGGTISYVALAKEFLGGINFGREAHYNYGRLIFSRAASEPGPDYPSWNRKRVERVCWEMICKGSLRGDEIVNPVVSFEESAEAYCKYVDTSPELSVKLGEYTERMTYLFQFLIGRLEAIVVFSFETSWSEFQFLIGSLEARMYSGMTNILGSFNSS